MAAHIPTLSAVMWILLSVTRLGSAYDPDCNQLPAHTSCKPPNHDCTIIQRLTAADRDLLLRLHNDYRSMVAKGNLEGFPPARDMMELIWHDELADVAQAHADQCTDALGTIYHDVERRLRDFPYVGQNVAGVSNNAPFQPEFEAFVKLWFDEYVHFQCSWVNAYEWRNAHMTGHFGQMIFSRTRYVGCGYVRYTVRGGSWTNQQLLVCNYAPGGNLNPLYTYRVGPTCCECREPLVCNPDTGLCDGSKIFPKIQYKPLPPDGQVIPEPDACRWYQPGGNHWGGVCKGGGAKGGGAGQGAGGGQGGGGAKGGQDKSSDDSESGGVPSWLPIAAGATVGFTVSMAGLAYVLKKYWASPNQLGVEGENAGAPTDGTATGQSTAGMSTTAA